MKKYDIVILTESRYENPTETNWYIDNVLKEDKLVQDALEYQGLKTIRIDWATQDFDWGSTEYALFRTTWDYFYRFEEFSDWLKKVPQKCKLINPLSIITWNIDKHYLNDLKERGINIPPTRFVEPGENSSLERLYEETGWQETVLKPTISGGGRHTYRLNRNTIAEHEQIFTELTSKEAMMLQPLQYPVIEQGEIALMMINGEFTHAMLKVAKPGDFRVQDDFGGTAYPYSPSNQEIAFAEKVIAACDPTPVYARVDVITDNDGNLALCELELIEPEMWFRHNNEAALEMAKVIKKYF